jgi:hypothetical protein
MIEGVLDIFPQEEHKGMAQISHVEFSNRGNPLFNMRAVRDGGWLFYMQDGKYVRLHINGQLMMSDTRMEKESNRDFINNAHGKVLIAGLGIGLILKNILQKEDITEITVIELYQDVIDLVGPKFNDPRIKYICADIYKWKPKKEDKYNVIYFDIWSEVSQDNLKDIATLHNRFKNSVDRTDLRCWMDSWMKQYLRNQKRKDDRESSMKFW